MKRRTAFTSIVAATLAFVLAGSAAVWAHDVLYPGTVLAVEAAKLHVKTVDPETKKDVNLWFTITDKTRVKRGDTVVTYAAAKIAKDERIVVVVNHEEGGSDTVATELRLAAK
ncbi:MAG: hypothetical protein R2752_12070 [Vicinamibacterales bacterium]